MWSDIWSWLPKKSPSVLKATKNAKGIPGQLHDEMLGKNWHPSPQSGINMAYNKLVEYVKMHVDCKDTHVFCPRRLLF